MTEHAATRLTVERMVAGGDALARHDDGRIVFVTGAIAGEVVDVEITEDRKDFLRAASVEIVVPSTARRGPPCRFRRAGCGGCDWMEIDETAQLDAKVGIVEESLRRIGRLDTGRVDDFVTVAGAVPAMGSRTSIRVVGTGDGVGYRQSGSTDVVPVDDCEVAHDVVREVLAATAAPPGIEIALRGSVATGEVSALVEDDRPRRGRRPRSTNGNRGGGDGGGVTASEGRSGRVDLPAHVSIGPRASIVERVDGADLRVSAPSFFQSGPAAAELLVAEVVRAAPELDDADLVVDLYGGVGLFAATAARSADHVVVVESSRSACSDARHNLRERSAEVIESDVAALAPSPSDRPDVVVADPARPGLARPGVAAVVAWDAPVVVLVSCDPVSMARDVRLLGESGYTPESVRVVDAFPQTHHVETITRLVRSP